MFKVNWNKLFLSGLLLMMFVCASAQKTIVYSQNEATYKAALKSFDAQKYSIAQKRFKEVYKGISDPHAELKRSSEYYHALCALKLFNDDAEELFIKFIEHHPQSPKIRLAGFQLGKYYYRNNEWRHVMKWLDKVDANELDSADVAEYYFKFAYALYKVKEFPKAQRLFNEAKQLESIYKSPAIFYYSYLSYKFNFNETALKGFDSLREDENFGAVVPYYIIQIYYMQGKYNEIIEYGPGLLENAIPKRAPGIARIIAEGYYRNSDYENAVKYLEVFMDKGHFADSTSNYQLAYSYYKLGEFEKSTPYFQKTSGLDSEVGQLSLFYLGDIYLKDGNKPSARNAYRFASKSSFNIEVKENALFNYAKLSFELDIDPYHESIVALERYIDQFPNSSKVEEARKYLLNVYLNTKNYQRAIVALDKIKKKDLDIQFAYQKIAYYRGIELFNNEKVGFTNKDITNYKSAIYYFQKSLEYPIDNKIKALSNYWRAEAYFRVGNMKRALEGFIAFKSIAGAILIDQYKEVDYQIAYCHLGLNDYGPAIMAFRKYLGKHPNTRTRKVNDANIRTGDSYLIIKGKDDLILSLKYYKSAISMNMAFVDYCYFQQAQAYMLLNNYTAQAKSLEQLITKFPDSKYIDEANFYLGETYLVSLKDYDLAIKYFLEVVEKHKGDLLLVQRAYNGLASSYSKKKNFEQALTHLENSVSLDPGSDYAFEAIKGHKLICEFEIGDFQRHIDFRDNVGLPSMTESAKDTSVFNAAKKFYLDGEYPTAIKKLKNYLNAFPKALAVSTANYLLAECYLSLNQMDQALSFYEKVLALPSGEFTERSAYFSAKIQFKNKEYTKAINRYLYLEGKSNYASYVLESRIGLMRSYRELQQHENCIKYAELVHTDEKVSNLVSNEAILTKAKSHFDSYHHEKALEAFKKTEELNHGAMGAEAKYYIAYIHYINEQYDESIEEVYNIAKKYPSQKTWITKGFILMSDNFVKVGDYFQAKYILKTIIDNFKGEELKQEALDKLQLIDELESAESVTVELKEEAIEIGERTPENKVLYGSKEEQEAAEGTISIDSTKSKASEPNLYPEKLDALPLDSTQQIEPTEITPQETLPKE
ncbi:MAG: tetratricopeptide (TPR) repeat protein [Saprospiraceae bacterium]|jgi:tetratricopeptide (TPR) repeat protein